MQTERTELRLRGVAVIVWLVSWVVLLIGLVAITGKLSFWTGSLAIAMIGAASFFVIYVGQERLRHR